MNIMIQKINKNNTTQKRIFLGLITVTAIIFILGNLEENLVQVYSQKQDQEATTNGTSIELTGKLIDNTYRWVDSSNTINPTLKITSSTTADNKIIVKSLQDDSEEHEVIIEGISSDGKKEEIIVSDEVQGGSSDIINFNLADLQEDDYQSFEYYCEYHPDTMRGKIAILMQ